MTNKVSILFEAVSGLGREYVIQVAGTVHQSDIASMGLEVLPTMVTTLSAADSPLPLDPTQKVKADFDTRLNHRVLDLRSHNRRLIFHVKACLVAGFREFLEMEEFCEVHTPKIVATGTEGGTELFPLQYFENKAFLAQSPQFYKQMLVGAGFERVYQSSAIFPNWKINLKKTWKTKICSIETSSLAYVILMRKKEKSL